MHFYQWNKSKNVCVCVHDCQCFIVRTHRVQYLKTETGENSLAEQRSRDNNILTW